MRGVTFAAWRGGTYLGLAEVLGSLADHVDGLTWQLVVDEAVGPHTEFLESGEAGTVTTAELVALTGPDSQVIDGEFIGFRDDSGGAPVMIIRAWTVRAGTSAATTVPSLTPCAASIRTPGRFPSRPPATGTHTSAAVRSGSIGAV
jgi:hypothetical protein